MTFQELLFELERQRIVVSQEGERIHAEYFSGEPAPRVLQVVLRTHEQEWRDQLAFEVEADNLVLESSRLLGERRPLNWLDDTDWLIFDAAIRKAYRKRDLRRLRAVLRAREAFAGSDVG